MKFQLKRLEQIDILLALRSAAILVQFFLILFVNLGLNYELPWLPLTLIIVAELIFTFASYAYYRTGKAITQKALFIQVLADVLFLSLLLYFSGGATNAFVSLLLLPIAIAAVTLPSYLAVIIAMLAVLSYSLLLWQLPMHVMHGNMEGHFIGMWINFLFSAVVVVLIVSRMAQRINKRELAIANFREEQLKQEKVIALGVASAQVTHQIATPISTVQLLADELKEDFPDNEVVDELQMELTRCAESLAEFRGMVFDIKQEKLQAESCSKVIERIKDSVNLNYPDIELQISISSQHEAEHRVMTNASLLPAILNLVNNAVRATRANDSTNIELASEFISQGNSVKWLLSIRDYGKGFTQSTLSELGVKPVNSKEGLGMAVLLSHASLESLGGKLSLTNHEKGGAQVSLSLPVVSEEEMEVK